MYFTALFATVFHIIDGSILAPISPILDSFEWYLRGAIIFLFVSGMKNIVPKDIISISKVYIYSSIFIAIIAALQALDIGDPFIREFLSFYEPGREGERRLNAISGRYSSILGQPVSYGIFFLFSISILLFYGDRIIHSRITRFFIFLFILFASILSISKVILIGVPILILSRILLAIIKLVKLRFEDYLCWSIFLIMGYFLTADSNIFAAQHLINSFGDLTSLLNIISQGFDARFGFDPIKNKDGVLVSDFKVFKENFLFGIGWSESGKGVHLGDSGYMPILVRSGVLGFFFYVSYLLAIFINSFVSLRVNFGLRDPVVMNYLFLFFISSIFALGTPIFYIDRSSDFFWMMSAIAIATRKKRLADAKNID